MESLKKALSITKEKTVSVPQAEYEEMQRQLARYRQKSEEEFETTSETSASTESDKTVKKASTKMTTAAELHQDPAAIKAKKEAKEKRLAQEKRKAQEKRLETLGLQVKKNPEDNKKVPEDNKKDPEDNKEDEIEPANGSSDDSTLFDPRVINVRTKNKTLPTFTTAREKIHDLLNAVTSITVSEKQYHRLDDKAKRELNHVAQVDDTVEEIESLHKDLITDLETVWDQIHVERTKSKTELKALLKRAVESMRAIAVEVGKLEQSMIAQNMTKEHIDATIEKLYTDLLKYDVRHIDKVYKDLTRQVRKLSTEDAPTRKQKKESPRREKKTFYEQRKREESPSDNESQISQDFYEERRGKKVEDEKKPTLRLKPNNFPTLRDSEETKGYTARIFLKHFKTLMDKYTYLEHEAINVLSGRVEKRDLSEKILTAHNLDIAYGYIIDEYGADDNNISLEFEMQLECIMKIKDYQDIKDTVDALEMCQNEASFAETMRKERSAEYRHLYHVMHINLKSEWENSNYKTNLNGLLEWLRFKRDRLKVRKQIDDNKTKVEKKLAASKPKPKPYFQATKIQNNATAVTEEKKKEQKTFSSKPTDKSKEDYKRCYICKAEKRKFDDHWSAQCSALKNIEDPKQRLALVKRLKVCEICLKDHAPHPCSKKEDKRYQCKNCQGSGHHRLLCPTKTEEKKEEAKPEKAHLFAMSFDAESGEYDLPTKYSIWTFQTEGFCEETGRKVLINAMIDNACEESFFVEYKAKQMKMPIRRRSSVQVKTTQGVQVYENRPIVRLILQNPDGSYQTKMNIRTMPPDAIPQCAVIDNAKLAKDYPEFAHLPTQDVDDGRIHLVIGQDHQMLQEILERKYTQDTDGPRVHRLPLGYGYSCPLKILKKYRDNQQVDEDEDDEENEVIAFNRMEVKNETVSEALYKDFFKKEEPQDPEAMNEDGKISFYLKKLFDSEGIDIKPKPPLSVEDQQVLKKTEETVKYEEGRITAKIPWKEDEPKPKNNYWSERQRVVRMQKILAQEPEKLKMYDDVIKGDLEKGYIEEIDDPTPDLSEAHYLMHRAVWRPGHVSSPCRRVNNASMPDFKGRTLNKCIFKGPDLTNKLLTVGMMFRKGAQAWITDCSEFFPQIKLAEEDKDNFRLLWYDQDGKLHIYRYVTLFFGLNCSPFLAQFASLKSAHENKEEFPHAYKIVKDHRYVDDMSFSHDSEETCIEALTETRQVMEKISVRVHKTLSNSSKIMMSVPQEARLKGWTEGQEKPTTSVLGITWNPNTDIFKISLTNIPVKKITTKREFLQVLAGQFDPFGFLCAFIIIAKLILQKMWSRGITWDEILPDDLMKEVNDWVEQLKDLEKLEIPRQVVEGEVIELHGYSDSSDEAMAACVYGRTADGKVGLILAKSKVHSLKPRSIQQKELQAAVLLSQLIVEVTKVYPVAKTTLWTDSTTALAWIMVDDPRKHVTFVHNRVGIIRENTKVSDWRHVPTKQNAADGASRGIPLKQLFEDDLFWKASSFLSDDSVPWPEEKKYYKTDLDKKKRFQVEEVFSNFIRIQSLPNPKDFTTFEELKLATARILKREDQDDGPVSVEDLKKAEFKIIQDLQLQAFPEEMQALEAKEPIPARSKLAKARPILDEFDVMRSDTRLANVENIDSETRYPIILPKNKQVTVLIIKEAHEKSEHAYSLNWTVDELKKRFYIPSCRQQVKKFLRSCRECRKNFGKPRHAVMAPLPGLRVNSPLKAFWNNGVDFAGPFLTLKGRGQARNKRWMCLFTCLYTRAVHLEIAYGMDTDNFLLCLNNFIARRGKIAYLWSDRGTNFRGAQTEIRRLIEQLSQTEQQEHLATKGIEFKFNTAFSPHQGGVWESMVKSCKRALFNVLKNQDFTDAMLIAALTQAENIVNSRPLGYQSTDPNDHRVITPNMLLTSRLDGYQMPNSVDNTDFNPRLRWRAVQKALQHVWKRFLREIIPNLGIRQKWTRDGRNYEVGDEVLIMDPSLPRYKWIIGRISQVYPGRDNIVRVVDVKLESGEVLNKTVHRLIPLT